MVFVVLYLSWHGSMRSYVIDIAPALLFLLSFFRISMTESRRVRLVVHRTIGTNYVALMSL